MPRILIVDDNSNSAGGMAERLTRTGHEARVALNCPDALRIGGVFRPDIVIVDIGLTDDDGLDVATHISKQTWAREASLIALNGIDLTPTESAWSVVGLSRYVPKREDFQALSALLHPN